MDRVLVKQYGLHPGYHDCLSYLGYLGLHSMLLIIELNGLYGESGSREQQVSRRCPKVRI